MKHVGLIALVMVIVFSSCQQKPKEKILKISGEITGAEGKVMRVSKLTLTGQEVLDTLRLENGKFTFSKKLDEASFIIIGDDSLEKAFYFFANNGEYTLKGSYNDLDKATITTQDPQAKKMIEICQKAKEISFSFYTDEVFNKIVKELDNAKINKDTARIKEFQKKYIERNNKLREKYLELIKDNPASVAAAFVGCSYEYYSPTNLEEMKKVYAILDTSLHSTSSYYRELATWIKKKEALAVGKEAPDFTLNDTEGKSVSLSSIKAKVLLVDFWASWCAPCRRENPNVVKVYKEFHDKGFDVLSVSLDDKKDNWLKAIKDDSLVWHHVSDLKGWKNAAAQLYGIRSVPTNYLLDENGVILAKNLRGDVLEQKVTELLGQEQQGQEQ